MRALLVLVVLCGSAAAQGAVSPVGLWRTFDDKTGQETGTVRITEVGGALYGRIERILDPTRAGLSCVKCPDDRKGKPLIGLDIMRGLKRDGDGWGGGTIVDPETGGIYKASARLADNGQKLVIHGYIGISLLGRDVTWLRTQ